MVTQLFRGPHPYPSHSACSATTGFTSIPLQALASWTPGECFCSEAWLEEAHPRQDPGKSVTKIRSPSHGSEA